MRPCHPLVSLALLARMPQAQLLALVQSLALASFLCVVTFPVLPPHHVPSLHQSFSSVYYWTSFVDVDFGHCVRGLFASSRTVLESVWACSQVGRSWAREQSLPWLCALGLVGSLLCCRFLICRW